MTNVTSIPSDVQEKVLEAVKEGQEALIGASRTWADAIAKATTDLPTPPWTAKAPEIAEAVDGAYAFAGQLLDAQHQLVKGLIEAWTPAFDSAQARASRRVAKSN